MTALAGSLEILGRVPRASNHTFLCALEPPDGAVGQRIHVIYKPVSGERPLWDFTSGTLADREYAAWLVSDALGWDLVPTTVLREGPHGFGMVQRWIDVDPDAAPVDVVPSGHTPPGYRRVLQAEDEVGRPVDLIHEDNRALRRMAAFDVVVNNTDRKGGHVLPVAGGHRFGVDHGVCFHEDDKLRTVLWGFAGEPADQDVLADVAALCEDADLLGRLAGHLTCREVDRFAERCRCLAMAGCYPRMGAGWPAIPWPPF